MMSINVTIFLFSIVIALFITKAALYPKPHGWGELFQMLGRALQFCLVAVFAYIVLIFIMKI